MTAVHSARWYRVAALRPRWVGALQVRRHDVRGERWVVVGERGATASVRLNAAAWDVAGRFDGRADVQSIWDALLAGDADPPTQDEVVDVLTRLRQARLVDVDGGGVDAERLLAHGDRIERPQRRNTLLAWRVRLVDPTRLVDRLAPLARALFSAPAFALWLVGAGAFALLALQHAPDLWAHGERWLATPRYAALALALYLPLKALHELAHALAVRRWGGTVPHAGVTFMLGAPMPWVDASAASRFVERRRRIVVGAAGMMAEVAVAAVALPLWLVLDDGLARDAAFVTVVVAGASTLLFNANPLQRLDGYAIATDALNLPNLATRSRQWWQAALLRRVVGAAAVGEPMPLARGEAGWLVGYAPLAWLWGLAIAAFATAWLGSVAFALGVATALVLGWQMALRPVVELWRSLQRNAQAQAVSARRWRVAATLVTLAVVTLLALPLPQTTRLQGIVWPADDAQVRADEEGFVVAVAVADGSAVAAGDAVLQLVNPALATALQRQAARVDALRAEWVGALAGDAGVDGVDGTAARASTARAGDAQAELAAAEAEFARLAERDAALTVRARRAGRVALPRAADLPGSYVGRGALLGQVRDGGAPTVRVALPAADAAALDDAAPHVAVRLASAPWRVHAATRVRDGAGAVRRLPSAALAQRHGGPIPTDPQDETATTPLQPVVLVDVVFDAAPAAAPPGGARAAATDRRDAEFARLGERAWVRLDRGHAPFALQAWRALQRAVGARFHPQV